MGGRVVLLGRNARHPALSPLPKVAVPGVLQEIPQTPREETSRPIEGASGPPSAVWACASWVPIRINNRDNRIAQLNCGELKQARQLGRGGDSTRIDSHLSISRRAHPEDGQLVALHI